MYPESHSGHRNDNADPVGTQTLTKGKSTNELRVLLLLY